MPRLPVMFFALCVLILASSRLSDARTDAEARLQCVAQCLKDFKAKAGDKTKELLKIRPDLVASECARRPLPDQAVDHNRKNCQTCFKTCSSYGTKEFAVQKSCRKFCTAAELPETQCSPVCNRVKKLLSTNPGDCPAKAQIGRSVCLSARMECKFGDDRKCIGVQTQRCCRTNFCGDVCMPVNVTLTGLPKIPRAPFLMRIKKPLKGSRRRGETKTGGLEARWRGYSLQDPECPDPIVFLMQIRSHKGLEFKAAEMSASSWTDLAYTSKLGMEFSDLKVGYWYQFRLVAISGRGFRGYSDSSVPVQLDQQPRRPSPPRDLREGRSRIHDGVVDVQLRWKKPRRSDLPLAKYELKWAENYGYIGGSEKNSLTDYRTAVPPANNDYYLTNLKPGTAYKVQVSAVVYYGSVQLRSRKSIIYITTLSIPTEKAKTEEYSEGLLQDLESAFTDCTCGDRRPGPVVTKTPYYEKGQVRMAVVWNHPSEEHQWQPVVRGQTVDSNTWVNTYVLEWGQKVCIDSGNSEVTPGDRAPRRVTVTNDLKYVISGLKFNCHYVLRVRGLSDEGRAVVQWRTCFCTPPCKQTQFQKGDTPPSCPREVGVHMPRSPLNVHASVSRSSPSSKDVVARITWAAPSIIYAISGFRISWGPRLQEDVPLESYGRGGLLPRLDPSAATTKVLESSRRSLLLRNLMLDEVYVVQVQTLTVFGDSPQREIFFVTPRTKKSKLRTPTQTVRAYVRPNAAQTLRAHFLHTLVSVLLLILSFLR